MKKLLLVILAVCIVLPSIAQSETAAEKNVLKVNTLALFVGTGSVFYERGFSDKLSGQLGFGYMGFKLGDAKFTGLILTPEVRFYPKATAIDGMYIAPYLRYQNFSIKDTETDDKGSLNSFGGGLLFGKQWITNSGFTMDLFFGGHYAKADVSVESGTESFDVKWFDGFRMRVGFALGFAF